MKLSLNQFLHIASIVSAPILKAAGVPDSVIPFVQRNIQDAEAASAKRDVPLTGAEKKVLVLNGVADSIATANAAKPGTIDPNVTGLVSQGIDVTIGTINAIHKKPVNGTVAPAGSGVSILD